MTDIAGKFMGSQKKRRDREQSSSRISPALMVYVNCKAMKNAGGHRDVSRHPTHLGPCERFRGGGDLSI
ncbi:hypothetical protein [Burkholderia thailandensis]|uniref:hypothetical protein n=1 Tax=Burkholderia thailandensis TaxID=57975 RepID=UPI000FD6A6F0|nr:hypothetical protein [Burkholderia thailandensis]